MSNRNSNYGSRLVTRGIRQVNNFIYRRQHTSAYLATGSKFVTRDEYERYTTYTSGADTAYPSGAHEFTPGF